MTKTVKRNCAKPRRQASPTTPLYRSLRGWAVGTLLETHAIIECSEHGHVRDRGTWPHGWDQAKAIAKTHPFAGSTPGDCVKAIDDVMASVGDVCPEC